MTGNTHRVGGVLSCFIGYTLLESKGLLIADVNPLLQLSVMYPFAIYGSIVSDLDHHAESAPSKDIVSVMINRVLHLSKDSNSPLNAKHRSWQTHSDMFLFFVMFLANYLLRTSLNSGDAIIIRLVSTGLLLGIISHLVLDMLTPQGVWSIILVLLHRVLGVKCREKFSFVPNTSFFATDGPWEKLINKIMWVVIIIFVIRFIYILQPYKII